MATRPAALLPLLTQAPTADRGPATDRDLLRRFAGDHDEAAFAALVRRHAPMVLGVCRRVLGNPADAEDACQATFLVLARKAGSAGWRPSVASWLYATARQVALNARTARARRARHEGKAPARPTVGPLAEITAEELLAILDEELGKLPERYRAPVVLCCVEGLTRDEAAHQLGVPAATLKGQLERGRKRLHDALARRGVALGAGLLALLATAPVESSPSRLVETIRGAVSGKAPPAVAALAERAAANGLVQKAVLLLAVAGVVALGSGLGRMSPAGAEPPKAAKDNTDRAAARPAADTPKPGPTERTIVGKVTGADGAPVVADLFLNWIEGKVEPLGTTKPDGTFRVTVPVKEHGGWLVARAPGHGMEFVGLRTESPAAVTIRLPRELPIRGRVIDPQGKPLANVRVTVDGLISYDGDSLAKHLKRWTDEFFAHGIPPGGDRSVWFRSDNPADREGGSPISVTTDAAGKFELKGVGAGQLVGLTVRGPGVARTQISVMNRDGFDPKPYLAAADESAKLVPARRGRYWQLYGPGPQVIAEREKVVRGTVTARDTGKPLAGVPVVVETREQLAYPQTYEAVTDRDGRYEVRGVRKHSNYAVECRPDPGTAYLAGRAEVTDTVGYESIAVDLPCWPGVVVTGTVRDKETGQPVEARVWRETLPDNPLAKGYPAHNRTGEVGTDSRGRFRFVTAPGPTLVQVLVYKGAGGQVYRPAKPDPKSAARVAKPADALWCRVIEPKPGDREMNLAIELEPAPRMAVRVADADGKPVTGAHATGITEMDFVRPVAHPDTDRLTVFNVEPGQERFVAAVHPGRRLVGTATVKADDTDPVVRLGPGGTVTGRVVGTDGKPLTGMTVGLDFTRRELREASEPLNAEEFRSHSLFGGRRTATDANGEFRFDALFVGHEFRLTFTKGKKPFGPDYNKAPRYTIRGHGDTRTLGDLTVEPTPAGGDE